VAGIDPKERLWNTIVTINFELIFKTFSFIMSNTNNNNTVAFAPQAKVVRFIASNPDQGFSATYNVGLGEKNAESYAKWNAKQNKGRVVVERLDGSHQVIHNFTVNPVKTVAKSV
jgi:hypothetical protein